MSVMLYAKTKQNRVEAHVLNGEQTEGAVLYTAQTLTAEEQAQARENINAPGFSDIPQKTSELENDSGFITAEDIPAIPTKTSELQNDSGFITSPNVVYCTCDTDGRTADKEATIVSGTLASLQTGDQAIVKFTYANGSRNPTLKIGNTDAKPIMRYGTTSPLITADLSWNAGTSFLLVYDGNYWQMVSWLNSIYPEISKANITSGTNIATGLITGRRAKEAVEAFAPVKDVRINGTSVVSGGVAEIPAKVTDLGTIDSSLYDDDMYVYLTTLTESGWYKFCWGNGDDFTYFVQVQSIDYDGYTYVNQHMWGAEEGASTEYVRGLRLENGEVVNERTVSYLTLDVANTAFSRVGHSHVRYVAQSQSVWDYCNSVAIQNNNPLVIYFDVSTSKTYLIETYMGGHQPVYKMQKVTEMNDISYFCQRSSYYYSGAEHWGSWYKFSGEVYTPGR